MINYILNLKNKVLFTIRILAKNITKNALSVEKFEIAQNNILVYFNNSDTRNMYIKNIEWVFLNKKILKGFNNKEAAKIGCMYAKYIFNSKYNE